MKLPRLHVCVRYAIQNDVIRQVRYRPFIFIRCSTDNTRSHTYDAIYLCQLRRAVGLYIISSYGNTLMRLKLYVIFGRHENFVIVSNFLIFRFNIFLIIGLCSWGFLLGLFILFIIFSSIPRARLNWQFSASFRAPCIT